MPTLDEPPAYAISDDPPWPDDHQEFLRALNLYEHGTTTPADSTDEPTDVHWTRTDLGPVLTGTHTEETPRWLTRTDGISLLYPGRHHDIHGEPADGKSWIALAACRDALHAGSAIIWVDWEDTAASFVTRLRALDVPDAIIGDPTAVAFIVPQGPFGLVDIDHLLELATPLNTALIVFDAMVDALALDGLDENSNADAARWLTRVCRPFNREGITTLVLDHVSRDPATRTRGARGGGSKLGFIDGASYTTKMVRPFDRNTPGEVRLILAKDRHGQIGPRGKTAARVLITPTGNGAHVDLVLKPDDTPHDDAGAFMPTVYMERVSRWLEDRPTEQHSQNQIEKGVGGKADLVRKAVTQLVAHGHVDEATGPRNARLFSILDPYRKPDEPDASNDLVPPRPHLVPDEDSRPRPGPASPTGQGRGQPDEETGSRTPDLVPPSDPTLDDREDDPW